MNARTRRGASLPGAARTELAESDSCAIDPIHCFSPESRRGHEVDSDGIKRHGRAPVGRFAFDDRLVDSLDVAAARPIERHLCAHNLAAVAEASASCRSLTTCSMRRAKRDASLPAHVVRLETVATISPRPKR